MKVLGLCSLLFVLPVMGHAFTGHGEFKVEMVKPWGEFGFRALGKGKNISEMRFDCSQNSEVGFVVTVINNYGKRSNVVLPGEKLGDKQKCHDKISKYFANVNSNRGLASFKDQPKIVDLNFVEGKKTLSFR